MLRDLQITANDFWLWVQGNKQLMMNFVAPKIIVSTNYEG